MYIVCILLSKPNTRSSSEQCPKNRNCRISNQNFYFFENGTYNDSETLEQKPRHG